jgi:hypothetical protein
MRPFVKKTDAEVWARLFWILAWNETINKPMRPASAPKIVLILGSAPDAVRSREWQRAPFDAIVAINNAWRVRDDWNYLVHAGDFPQSAMPVPDLARDRKVHTASDYVPAQNAYGGFVYAGATMSLTSAYWALHRLKPDVLAFLGCDMNYDQAGPTHFYGYGNADPLRPDVTLQSLEAKTGRLMISAARQGCICVNLSRLDTSRLVFPRVDIDELAEWSPRDAQLRIDSVLRQVDEAQLLRAEIRERTLGYYFPSGEYWLFLDQIDARELRCLDDLWLAALGRKETAPTPECSETVWKVAAAR